MWQNIQIIFLSIVLESLPFVLLGVVISSLIQEIVSQDKLIRIMPRNKKMAVLYASLLGMIIPVCDCGTVPVARSLMQKGVPVAAAMSFTLAAPVVNPLTMVTTYIAFGMNPDMMWLRVGTTWGIAVLIGWVFLACRIEKVKVLPTARKHLSLAHFSKDTAVSSEKTPGKVLNRILGHALVEFFEVGIFVVISAMVAAILQTCMPASIVSSVGQHPFWSVIAMMTLAVLLSLCAQADAFVARSLAGMTTTGGLVGFLVIGQMIDIRNFFLLPRAFYIPVVIFTFILSIVLT